MAGQFDPEVVAELRRQFDSADKDGNGELDAAEACKLFARECSTPGASAEEVRRLAESLRHQLDGDRSATISFDEYLFRFGRKSQTELARRRRAGQAAAAGANTSANSSTPSAPPADESVAGAALRREREAMEAEREALRREREEMQRERMGEEPEVLFAGGTKVTISGLRGAPELNGRTATVLRYDRPAGRYVVDIDWDGGQKSLKADNLTAVATPPPQASPSRPAAAAGTGTSNTGPGLWQRVQTGFQKACVHVQCFIAQYEWWQIALGVAVVVIVVGAWLENSAKYSGGSGSRTSAGPRHPMDEEIYGDDEPEPDYGYGSRDDGRGSRDYGHGSRDDRSNRHTQRDDYHNGRMGHHGRGDDYGRRGGAGGNGGGGGGGGLLGGLLGGENGQLYTALIVGGIGYLCWKGIIPVHRMSFFQIYMLWNMLSPLLLGNRGGGGYGRRGGMGGMGGMGGFGRRRGMGFF